MAQNKMIQFAMNLINRNPQIANNPMAQELIRIIQNGSEQRGGNGCRKSLQELWSHERGSSGGRPEILRRLNNPKPELIF